MFQLVRKRLPSLGRLQLFASRSFCHVEVSGLWEGSSAVWHAPFKRVQGVGFRQSQVAQCLPILDRMTDKESVWFHIPAKSDQSSKRLSR